MWHIDLVCFDSVGFVCDACGRENLRVGFLLTHCPLDPQMSIGTSHLTDALPTVDFEVLMKIRHKIPSDARLAPPCQASQGILVFQKSNVSHWFPIVHGRSTVERRIGILRQREGEGQRVIRRGSETGWVTPVRVTYGVRQGGRVD